MKKVLHVCFSLIIRVQSYQFRYEKVLVSYIETLFWENWRTTTKVVSQKQYLRLLHDNAPAHTARIVTKSLESEKVTVLPQPPFLPDLVPCGHLVSGKNTVLAMSWTCYLLVSDKCPHWRVRTKVYWPTKNGAFRLMRCILKGRAKQDDQKTRCLGKPTQLALYLEHPSHGNLWHLRNLFWSSFALSWVLIQLLTLKRLAKKNIIVELFPCPHLMFMFTIRI